MNRAELYSNHEVQDDRHVVGPFKWPSTDRLYSRKERLAELYGKAEDDVYNGMGDGATTATVIAENICMGRMEVVASLERLVLKGRVEKFKRQKPNFWRRIPKETEEK